MRTGLAVHRCRSPCHQLKRQDLMAGSVAAACLHPFLEHRRRHHLADAVVARGEIGRAEHAELLDEVRQAAAIDHDGNGRAGAGLLQHVLVGAELRVGEQLDLDRAVRAGLATASRKLSSPL